MRLLHPKQVRFCDADYIVIRTTKVQDKRLAGFAHVEHAREFASSLHDQKVWVKQRNSKDVVPYFPPGHIKPEGSI